MKDTNINHIADDTQEVISGDQECGDDVATVLMSYLQWQKTRRQALIF